MNGKPRAIWIAGLVLGWVLAVIGIYTEVFWLRITGALLPALALVVAGVLVWRQRRQARSTGSREAA